jgi:hypothetical protein
MLKAELEKWKEDTEKKAQLIYDALHNKSVGDVGVDNYKTIYAKACEILGKEVPVNKDE